MSALPESTEPAESGLVGVHGDAAGASGAAAGGPSDSELLARVRGGDKRAYGALWNRHHRAGLHAARAITSAFDADDLVSEAFVRVLKAIERGNGPTAAFRPYLVTTIRSVAARWGAQPAEITPDELEVVDPDSSDEAFGERFDQGLTVQAFNTLPQRWQEVLWYTEAEQLPPREVAALIGIKPNAVSALAKRAKEGLRHAWVQAHISTVPENSECRWSIDRLAASTRKSLPAREQDRLDAHLDECDRCPLAAAEMSEASHRLGALILIGFLGAGAATAYGAFVKPAAASAATIGAGALWPPKPTHLRNAAIGAAAAAVVAAAGVAYASGAIGPAHHSATSAVAAADPSSSSESASTDASAADSSTSAPPASAPTDSAAPASAAAPVVVSSVDTGEGLYFPIITGTGAPGSAVSATQASTSAAPASTHRIGRVGTMHAALARPGTGSLRAVAAVERKSTTTVAGSGTFTLGPLSWVQPGADGTARLTITQKSPSGETTTATVTVKIPKPTLGLTAPLGSNGSQLAITGVKNATVAIRFSDGNIREVVLDGSGHGSVAIPAEASSVTVVYAKSGRFGPAQTVRLSQLPVLPVGQAPAKPGSGAEPAGASGGKPHTGTDTPSDPGAGTSDPGDGNGTDPSTDPGDGTDPGADPGDGSGDAGQNPPPVVLPTITITQCVASNDDSSLTLTWHYDGTEVAGQTPVFTLSSSLNIGTPSVETTGPTAGDYTTTVTLSTLGVGDYTVTPSSRLGDLTGRATNSASASAISVDLGILTLTQWSDCTVN